MSSEPHSDPATTAAHMPVPAPLALRERPGRWLDGYRPEDPSVLLRPDGPDAGPQQEARPTPGTTVCHCAGVTRGRIAEAVEQGAATLEEVRCATRAATGCGGCGDAVRRLVEEHAAAV